MVLLKYILYMLIISFDVLIKKLRTEVSVYINQMHDARVELAQLEGSEAQRRMISAQCIYRARSGRLTVVVLGMFKHFWGQSGLAH